MFPVIWWVWEHILTERTKPGRKVQAEAILGHGDPWIRQKEKDIERRGVERTRGSPGWWTAARRPRTARCSTWPT